MISQWLICLKFVDAQAKYNLLRAWVVTSGWLPAKGGTRGVIWLENLVSLAVAEARPI